MTRLLNRSLPALVLVVVLIAVLAVGGSSAQAVQITAGWTHADVGLQNEGDGFFAGIGNDIPWSSKVFDAGYALEYVQKVGSQPTFFSDPVDGFTTEDAQVTLHYLQPSILMGARIPDLGFVPRIYAGMSFALKVEESWSDFPGQAHLEWGYKSSDFCGFLGLSLGVGRVSIEFRFTQGLTEQLLLDTTMVAGSGKAEEGPEGTYIPEDGAKISYYQLGAGFSF